MLKTKHSKQAFRYNKTHIQSWTLLYHSANCICCYIAVHKAYTCFNRRRFWNIGTHFLNINLDTYFSQNVINNKVPMNLKFEYEEYILFNYLLWRATSYLPVWFTSKLCFEMLGLCTLSCVSQSYTQENKLHLF